MGAEEEEGGEGGTKGHGGEVGVAGLLTDEAASGF